MILRVENTWRGLGRGCGSIWHSLDAEILREQSMETAALHEQDRLFPGWCVRYHREMAMCLLL